MSQLTKILEPFIVSNEFLIELKSKINQDIEKGLKKETHSSSDLKCYPTWLQDLPTGCEHGMFLVIRLCATQFHIAFIHLQGENKYRIQPQTIDIPEKVTDPFDFFDLIVNKLFSFLKILSLEREPLPVAIVLSRPLHHMDLSNAIVLNYFKGSRIKGLDNKDISQLLREALKRKHEIRLELVAVLSDATSVFLSSAWHNINCKVSVIIGECIHLAYIETVSKIELLDVPTKKKEMLVNAELGSYGNKHQLKFIQTAYDIELNDESHNVDEYIFQKMASGYYIAEIIRKVIVNAIAQNELFDGHVPRRLLVKNAITLEHVNVILNEKDGFYNTPLIFDKMGITSPHEAECNKVYKIVEAITMRSAHLIAATLAAVIDRLCIESTELPIVIGIDGSLYSSVPMYHNWVEEKLKELISNNHPFKLVYAMDAHNRGAAIYSAIAMRKNYIYDKINDGNIGESQLEVIEEEHSNLTLQSSF